MFHHREKFPAFLFVAASLMLFGLFILFLILSVIGANPIITFLSGLRSEQSSSSLKINKYYLNKKSKPADDLITNVPSLKDALSGPIISEQDPSLGAKNAPVAIVEFADFACEYCQKQEKILKQAMEKYKTRLIWKDYPSSDEKSFSFQAAVAARCAGEQDKFWEFHDLLFTGKKNLKSADFENLAKEVGIDIGKFKDCRLSGKAAELVRDNIKEANALEITGVPFIYINDQEIMGEASYDEIARIIEIENKIPSSKSQIPNKL